jgi:hypothetical protein
LTVLHQTLSRLCGFGLGDLDEISVIHSRDIKMPDHTNLVRVKTVFLQEILQEFGSEGIRSGTDFDEHIGLLWARRS